MVARLVQDKNTISIVGTIQFSTVLEIVEEAHKLIPTMSSITVNLKNLEHCDSSGLAFCTAILKEAAKQNKHLTFINIPDFMQDILRVYGLDSILPIKTV